MRCSDGHTEAADGHRRGPDDFVGRREPLASLAHRAELATIGRGSFVLVSGPAGIGKSRLCAELAAGLKQPSPAGGPIRVIESACWTHGGAPPLWPWHDILRRLDGEERAPDAGPDRFAFFEQTLARLRAAAERQPLVLILEDLHAADEGTLLATRFVARHLSDARILLVASARPVAPAPTDRPAGPRVPVTQAGPGVPVTQAGPGVPVTQAGPRSGLLAELEQAATVVALTGLDRAEVDQLVRIERGESDPATVEVLAELTGGHPLAIRSILRAAPPGPLTEALPLGVRDSATSRLRVLDPASAAVLSRAAVLGVRSTVDLVAELCGVDHEQVTAARCAGLGADLLVPSAPDELRFAHELVTDALVADLPSDERAAVNAAAARAIGATDPTPVGRLRAARHALAGAGLRGPNAEAGLRGPNAGTGRSPAERCDALSAAVDAARDLAAAQAYADAGALLSEAVEVARRTGDGRVPAPLLRDRASAELRAGRVAEAHQWFTEAVDAAMGEGDPVVVAEAATGLGGIWMNDVRSPVDQGVLLRQLRAARRGLPPGHDGLAIRLDARIAVARVFWEHAGIEVVLDAVDAARASTDVAARLDVLSTVHTSLLAPEWNSLRLELSEQMVRDAGDLSDGIFPLMARCWRTVDLFLAGDSTAPRALSDLRGPAEALQSLSVLYVVRGIEVMLAIRSGRLVEAERLAADALELGLRSQDVDARHFHGAQLVTIRWLQGRDAELLELVEALNASPEQNARDVAFDAAAAAIAARSGRPDLARRHLHRLTVEHRLEDLPRFSTWSVTMCGVIEAAVALDDTATAKQAYDLLAPAVHLPVTPSLAVTCFGSAHLFLGMAARATGDLEQAVHHLEEAVEADIRFGHAPAAAMARGELALTMARRGAAGPDRRGDVAAAAALLDRAIADASTMGMGAVAERWRARRDELAVPAGSTDDEVVVIHPVAPGGWSVEFGDERAVLGDRTGMRHLAQLTGAPGVEVPAVALMSGATDRRRVSGCRQEVLDRAARTSLERRARELAGAIANARERGDLARQSALEEELDAVAGTLRRDLAPNGRSRSFTDDAERARTAVRKAILRAIGEIDRVLPAAGDHLRESVSTGSVCCYGPRA